MKLSFFVVFGQYVPFSNTHCLNDLDMGSTSKRESECEKREGGGGVETWLLLFNSNAFSCLVPLVHDVICPDYLCTRSWQCGAKLGSYLSAFSDKL